MLLYQVMKSIGIKLYTIIFIVSFFERSGVSRSFFLTTLRVVFKRIQSDE